MTSDSAPLIPGRVELLPGEAGLSKLRVTSNVSVAEIYLNGATLTHFQKAGDPPLLFVSRESRFAEGQPIRGGIPIIFPWFGARDGMSAHGFARITPWICEEASVVASGAEVHLRLGMAGAQSLPGMPPFRLRYDVQVGADLKVALITTHMGDVGALEFEQCLHTYFEVGDIERVALTGLKGAEYLDKMDGFRSKRETGDEIRIGSETDRVYQGTETDVLIHDASLGRTIRVAKRNSQSTVVWNPWVAKSKAMPDFGDEEYRRMVCVESGNVGARAVSLAPGASHRMDVEISSHIFEREGQG